MKIVIRYYENENDGLTYQSTESSFEDALAFIGKLERIEQAAFDKAVVEAKNAKEIPF